MANKGSIRLSMIAGLLTDCGRMPSFGGSLNDAAAKLILSALLHEQGSDSDLSCVVVGDARYG